MSRGKERVELRCRVADPPRSMSSLLLPRTPERKNMLEGGTLALLLHSLLRGTANLPELRFFQMPRLSSKHLRLPGRVSASKYCAADKTASGHWLGHGRTQARPNRLAAVIPKRYNTLGLQCGKMHSRFSAPPLAIRALYLNYCVS